ncbi:hypothetical protein NE237_008662 [Protea cynaroides]|uniref:Uncharacterized protein n=1 Tax=Protea cynaroides TaxID=273540 RepID=A0A9Q0KWB2_9MAGN|nr:hypothetical protein NE237_008662 [Protea cynaroides]
MLEKPKTPLGTYVVQVLKIKSTNFHHLKQLLDTKDTIAANLTVVAVAAFPSSSPLSSSSALLLLSSTLSSSRKPLAIQSLITHPNMKIGIYYEPSSSISIYTSSNVKLKNGTLLVFYQPMQNVMVFYVIIKGTMPLTMALSSTLQQQHSAGKIPSAATNLSFQHLKPLLNFLYA